MRTEQGGDDRPSVGRVGGGSRGLVPASALWRRALIGVIPTLAVLRLARDRRDGLRLQRARKRGAGVRHRVGPERSDVAAEEKWRNGVHAERGHARRVAVPERGAGEALPRPAELDRRRIRADHRPHASRGAVEPPCLQTADPEQRIHVPDDARRHPAGDRRPPAELPVDETQRCGSDADRILGIRLREPCRPRKRARRSGQRDGFRRGRREHARYRLLGRCLQLFRTAAESRCVRRDPDDRPPAVGAPPQGRNVRRLLRRDQPAFRRSASAAGP